MAVNWARCVWGRWGERTEGATGERDATALGNEKA